MKKRFSFYLYAFLASFSLISQAMEVEQNRPELEALQKIAALAFPSPIYERDSQPDHDKNKVLEASKYVQCGTICTFPVEIYLDTLFPCMDTPLGAGLGRSCKFFYQLSQVSFLHLNPYCLQERMPHVIPTNILRFKTLNTEGGLLKLAALCSVSAGDICGWFEPVFLQSAFLSCQGSLPAQLAGQSDEALGTLYPVLKVSLAAIQAKGANEEQKTSITEGQKAHVMRLAREFNNPYGAEVSLNKLWLLTLNPDRPEVYYPALEQLSYQVQMSHQAISLGVSVGDIQAVIARELFMSGKQVANVNFRYCHELRHQKDDLASQVIELCLQYPHLIQHYEGQALISIALELERPDLALGILSWVVKLPDDVNTLHSKVRSLGLYKDIKVEDKGIQSYLKQFTSNLYPGRWAEVPSHAKGPACVLLMMAERRDDVSSAVNDLVLQSEEGFIANGYDLFNLISQLDHYHYPEEAEKLTLRLLSIEPDKFMTAFPYRGMDDFYDDAIKIDREKTIALLKGYVESTKEIHKHAMMAALVLLAKFTEKEYVLSKMDTLSEEQIGRNVYGDISEIYYYLGNKELCDKYFQQGVKKRLEKIKKYSHKSEAYLQYLQKQGHKITCLEDLQTMDCFEFFDVQCKKTELGEAHQAG